MREQTQAARLAAAQQTLAEVEATMGLRRRLTGATQARRSSARVSASEMSAAVPEAVEEARLLPVPAPVAPLLPHGALVRGTATQVQGSTSLLLAMAAAACSRGAWCAVMSMPDVGLAAAVEAGLDLEHTVLVPAPGPDAAAVLGALVDGFDVVVVGRCPALSERDRRAVLTRIRTREAVLLSTAWPQAHVRLSADATTWFGAGAGSGVLTSGEVTVVAHARGAGAARVARMRMTGAQMLPAIDLPRGSSDESSVVAAPWARAG